MAQCRLLFAWMENNDLTMTEFSHISGISIRTLSRMKKIGKERNPNYVPSLRTLEVISQVTDLRIEEILTLQPEDQETD